VGRSRIPLRRIKCRIPASRQGDTNELQTVLQILGETTQWTNGCVGVAIRFPWKLRRTVSGANEAMKQ
jgi:hypothetical protein